MVKGKVKGNMIAALFLIVNISFILTFIYDCKLPQPKLSDNEYDFNKCDFKVNNIIKKEQISKLQAS